jgi:hypothetical protein
LVDAILFWQYSVLNLNLNWIWLFYLVG